MGKSVEGCEAQEMASPQRQNLEGSEGRRAEPEILRLTKRVILSSAPGYQSQGCHTHLATTTSISMSRSPYSSSKHT